VSAPLLPEMGVNLFNMGFDITLNELQQLTQRKVTLLGNIPPRDVLASGDVDKVSDTAVRLVNSLQDKSKIIFSCGGGMPPDVNSENIKAFVCAVRK
jgi:uroporphyrinogen decarboxylase